MKSKSKVLMAFCCVPFIAACGGDGDSDLAPPTFTEMDASQAALEALYDPQAARTDVPAVDTATYAGYVGGALLGDGRDLLGELELTADFQTTAVTGSADSFADSNEQAFVGSLGFTGNVVFGGDSATPDSMLGTLDGFLNADGTTYDTEIILDTAEFKGGVGAALPDAISGLATGDLLDVNDPVSGFILFGDFIVEKQ